jgi:hypothetical protein
LLFATQPARDEKEMVDEGLTEQHETFAATVEQGVPL